MRRDTDACLDTEAVEKEFIPRYKIRTNLFSWAMELGEREGVQPVRMDIWNKCIKTKEGFEKLIRFMKNDADRQIALSLLLSLAHL